MEVWNPVEATKSLINLYWKLLLTNATMTTTHVTAGRDNDKMTDSA